MSNDDWIKSAAMAIRKEGYFKFDHGHYGSTYSQMPACHGFSVIGKIKSVVSRRFARCILVCATANPDFRNAEIT